MNADTLRDFTLKAREILIAEVEDQLEGIHGLLAGGKFEPAAGYPALAQIPECAETRERLESFIADEKGAGLEPKAARRKLAKEAAFTWLNRLVALKMMEARKLVRQTVSKGADSNGFKMWLTEPGNEPHLADYEAGEMPKDARGEGPRDRAYRRFLLAQCGRLAEEIRVLFDPDNLASRLAPRPTVLAQLIDMTGADELAEAWQPGNEETIGWVYQFFIEDEKADVFDGFYKRKQKVRPEDIPAATQIFTPRWIVKCLVQNTLGRAWLQMHPDSTLADKLDYLVPLEGETPAAPLKPVREITLLDPACGTMHFGLVAFDLFVEMYREELARAGEEGWPEEASVTGEEEIAASIIANNIHGIDIDLRAVQLSAMTLFIKAKMVDPKARISDSKLACTDTRMILGDRFQAFLDKLGRPIYRRILTTLAKRLEHADQLGSLLRPDEEVRKLIEQERKKYEKEGRQPDLFGWSREQFDTDAGLREFWETLETQIAQAIDAFGRDEAEAGHDASFFVGEAAKGLRMLELLAKRYDIVVTNPPYMTSRNMNAVMNGFLKKEYSAAKRDLYAAFIQRCTELLADTGRLGMITQQSFMFISSYENLRTWLRDRVAIETMPHTGPRAFAEVTGEKVNTTLLVVRREGREAVRGEAVGTYFRLVKEPDAEAKRTRFEQAVAHLQSGHPDPLAYHYRQADFDAIPGSPWVYWITPGLRNLFVAEMKLEEVSRLCIGMRTGDDRRFLRSWWEVGLHHIGRRCRNSEEAIRCGRRWFPYMKGGGSKRWYGHQELVVLWAEDGREVKANTRHTYPELGENLSWKITNEPFYFRVGVTWSNLSSTHFSARLSPSGFIFSTKGSCAFCEDPFWLLGLLNSSFARFALSLINPTVSFEAGDLSRMPCPRKMGSRLPELVRLAVDLAATDSLEDELTYDFVAPPTFSAGAHEAAERLGRVAETEREIDEEVYGLYEISDEDRATIEAELVGGSVANVDENSSDDAGDTEEAEQVLTPEQLAWRWLSYAVGIVMDRFQPGVEGALGRGDFSDEVARRLRELADEDGILVQDEGHPDDLAARTLDALRVMLGDDDAREVVLTATGKTGETEAVLRKYLEGPFFKEHIRLYRKRPVYWLLQSPKKKYGIWVFHERLTGDSLYRIQREYVDPKVKLLDGQLAELRKHRDTAAGRERRQAEKEIAAVEDVLADIREFAARLDRIIQRGYTPHIDDGVLLNMAPLWELVPSWQAEPKKAWKALEKGDYDWAHHAMDYWPERVKEKCKENKSFAIAHGLA